MGFFCIALFYGSYVNCLFNVNLSLPQRNWVRVGQQGTIIYVDARHYLKGLELLFASLKVLCGLDVLYGLDILGTFAKYSSQGT